MSNKDKAADFFKEAAEEVKKESERPETTTWKPDEGDVLQGTLTDAIVRPTRDGRVNFLLTVEEYGTDDVYSVWVGDSPFMLKQKILDNSPKKGSLILISYTGKQQNKDGTRSYRVYDVRTEETDFEFWNELVKQKMAKEQQAAYNAGSPDVGVPDDLPDPF